MLKWRRAGYSKSNRVNPIHPLSRRLRSLTGSLSNGALEGTRTPTSFRTQRPQRCASTNSATRAWCTSKTWRAAWDSNPDERFWRPLCCQLHQPPVTSNYLLTITFCTALVTVSSTPLRTFVHHITNYCNSNKQNNPNHTSS